MKKQAIIISVILSIIILFSFLQYLIILKKQNDYLALSLEQVRIQIGHLESKNLFEQWNAKISSLEQENKALKRQIETVSGQLRSAVRKEETPVNAQGQESKKGQKPQSGNKGFLKKKI